MSTRDPDRGRGPYVESTIIMTTVRVVLPFVFTFGLFVMFHGAESAGGGFQGGVILGASIVMVAFAFGIDPTREWLDEATLRGVVLAGVLAFLAIGLGAMAAGGVFLEYSSYGIHHASKYGIEAVELAIGGIVSGGVVALFFALAGAATADDRHGHLEGGSDTQ